MFIFCTRVLLKLASLAFNRGRKPLSVMFSFTVASRLNSSKSRCSEMILENCWGRRGCDSDEDCSEGLPLFFGNSELLERERWQRRSTGIIVLLLRLTRLIHHAAAGSGGVGWRTWRRRRRKMRRGRRDPARKWGLSAALQKSEGEKKRNDKKSLLDIFWHKGSAKLFTRTSCSDLLSCSHLRCSSSQMNPLY